MTLTYEERFELAKKEFEENSEREGYLNRIILSMADVTMYAKNKRNNIIKQQSKAEYDNWCRNLREVWYQIGSIYWIQMHAGGVCHESRCTCKRKKPPGSTVCI